MIILFGVVGSGKSEQANRLEQKIGCPHITVSYLLRQQANPEWEKLMMAGRLVPDEVVFSVLEPEFARIDAANREFILDGAPRTVAQAEWLIKKIKDSKIKLTAIIHLKVSRETTMKRLLARGRLDDKEEIIAERFKQYEAVTTPVLEYLWNRGYKIYEVDGEWSADVVERQLWQILKDKIDASQE